MKRNKEGQLVFANEAEKNDYYAKKEAFLRNTDEQNAAEYNNELIRKYGKFTYEE